VSRFTGDSGDVTPCQAGQKRGCGRLRFHVKGMLEHMYTIERIRSGGIEVLKRARVESPELTADLLIGFVTGLDRVFILSHPEHMLDDDARRRLNDLVRRRVRGEPLQYLTGEREFYGRMFRVTPDVLIPRPETEFLVEAAVDLIGKHFPAAARFVDVGTGSGCIAVSVLREAPFAFGLAVDCSLAALGIARENAVRQRVERRAAWICGDLLESFIPEECCDLILSNPPYIARRDYSNLPVEVREFEPDRALFGGEDGLEIYRRLIPSSLLRLRAGGYLLLEMGLGQLEAVSRMAEETGFLPETVVNDLQGIPRCFVARKPFRRMHG